ncbi:MAG: acyltransferase, partial [Arenimonas sp.]
MQKAWFLPPNAPHSQSGKWIQRLGRGVLKLGGWKIAGEWPNLSKMVMIAAPHSSGWDAVWGMAVKAAIGVDIV